MSQQLTQPTKSFSARVFEGVFWVSAGSLAVRVVGFLVSVFLLSTFTLHEYGTYQLVLAAGGLLSLLMLQGIDDVMVAEGSRAMAANDRVRYQNVLRGYWIFKMVTGGALWAVLFFGTSLFSGWYSGDILALLRWYAAVFLVIPFERIAVMHLSVTRSFGRLSLYSFTQETLKAILIFMLVGVFHRGTVGVLIAMVVSMGFSAVLFGIPACLQMCTFHRVSWTPFIDLLKTQGPWVIGQRLIRQGEKNLRPFFIQLFLGREAVALYSVAEKIYSYIAAAFPIDDVLMPMIAGESQDHERMHRIVLRGIKYSIPVYAVIAVVSSALVPAVFHLFFPQYAPAIPLVWIVLTYVPFIGCAFILTSFYVSHQAQKQVFYFSLVRGIAFMFILPLCMWLFGILGLGVEFFLTMMGYNVMRLMVLQKTYPETRIRWSEFFQIDSYDRAVFQRVWTKLYPFSKT